MLTFASLLFASDWSHLYELEASWGLHLLPDSTHNHKHDTWHTFIARLRWRANSSCCLRLQSWWNVEPLLVASFHLSTLQESAPCSRSKPFNHAKVMQSLLEVGYASTSLLSSTRKGLPMCTLWTTTSKHHGVSHVARVDMTYQEISVKVLPLQGAPSHRNRIKRCRCSLRLIHPNPKSAVISRLEMVIAVQPPSSGKRFAALSEHSELSWRSNILHIFCRVKPCKTNQQYSKLTYQNHGYWRLLDTTHVHTSMIFHAPWWF